MRCRSGASRRGEQAEPVVEPPGHAVHAEPADASGGQLQRQRQPVEPGADRGDRGGVGGVEGEPRRGGRSAVGEHPDGARRGHGGDVLGIGGQVQRRNLVEHLPGHGERLPARREHPQPGRGRQEQRHELGGLRDDVLAVVEHEQQPPGTQGVAQLVGEVGGPDTDAPAGLLADPQHRRHQLGHPDRRRFGGPARPDPREIDEPRAVGEHVRLLRRDLDGDLQGEPRLADPARPGERHQPARREPLAHHRDGRGPADQRRHRRREVAAGASRGRRRGGDGRQRGVVPEDRRVERHQLRPGVQAQVVDQAGAERGEAVQGLALPACPV
nr:hypothetical protein [Pseudonocardia nigra]